MTFSAVGHEKKIFTNVRPSYGTINYCAWIIELQRVTESIVIRAFENLAILDPPNVKGAGHNMTLSAMSRRITNFVRNHRISKVDNDEENDSSEWV